MVSTLPLLQATSMACLIALSTLLAVVLYFLAMAGYNSFVTALNISISFTTVLIASRRYRYPLIWAGTPISCIILVISTSRLWPSVKYVSGWFFLFFSMGTTLLSMVCLILLINICMSKGLTI